MAAKPVPFPLEKILTIGAQEYVDSIGKKLSDYVVQGVNLQFFKDEINETPERFAKRVPKYAEVVVCYRSCVSVSVSVSTGDGYARSSSKTALASGTALIPKGKWKRYIANAKPK